MGEDKTCEILWWFKDIRLFGHCYVILSSNEMTVRDDIWTMSSAYELEKGSLLWGSNVDATLPNWSYDGVPNNDLISGPTSVNIDLANTDFVMLIQDKDGTAGDVAIGAAHELDILFDPDDPALSGNWVWNNMPDGTPDRFADPSPQAVIYRTQLTHATDPYPDGEEAGVLSFSNSATSGFYRIDGPNNMLGYGVKMRIGG